MASGPSARNPAPSALISRRRRPVMQRSSETIGAIAGALAKAQIELAKPGEVADRDHPLALPARRRPQLPLRVLIQRARSGAQVAGPARDCDRADHLDRRGSRADPADHDAGAFVRRMGRPPTGRSARSARPRPRIGWERPSPTPGAMRCSRWSGLPARMISMRRISTADWTRCKSR